MKKLILSLILILSTLTASARIGETVDQCKTRYGQPVKVEGHKYRFNKGKTSLQVEFVEGKAAAVTYLGQFTDFQVQELLKANAGGDANWIEAPPLPDEISLSDAWANMKKGLGASHTPSEFKLVIIDMKQADKIQKLAEKDEKKAIDGL